MARKLKYWIKLRHNPQLGTFAIPCGQMTVREAKEKTKTLYGSNEMIPFDTEEEYKEKLAYFQRS